MAGEVEVRGGKLMLMKARTFGGDFFRAVL